jgi:hypothetical protein
MKANTTFLSYLSKSSGLIKNDKTMILTVNEICKMKCVDIVVSSASFLCIRAKLKPKSLGLCTKSKKKAARDTIPNISGTSNLARAILPINPITIKIIDEMLRKIEPDTALLARLKG